VPTRCLPTASHFSARRSFGLATTKHLVLSANIRFSDASRNIQDVKKKSCQMASSPASVFSSPSRRPSAGSTRPKPKLCRRWSMDNINCKEGYVKDLRKQHQAQQVGQRDEAYPFMMSESRRRGRISSLGTTPTICETRPSNNTRPLSCSPPHHSKNLFFSYILCCI
jgi:hypothetical protein